MNAPATPRYVGRIIDLELERARERMMAPWKLSEDERLRLCNILSARGDEEDIRIAAEERTLVAEARAVRMTRAASHARLLKFAAAAAVALIIAFCLSKAGAKTAATVDEALARQHAIMAPWHPGDLPTEDTSW